MRAHSISVISSPRLTSVFFFFFNDTATTEIYTLSLHDALPICPECVQGRAQPRPKKHFSQRRRQDHATANAPDTASAAARDRKSTRLNSSHLVISYAVFCLKKKNIITLDYAQHVLTTVGAQTAA